LNARKNAQPQRLNARKNAQPQRLNASPAIVSSDLGRCNLGYRDHEKINVVLKGKMKPKRKKIATGSK
jgi:hypothetical protein